jgi:outer membrane protein assembly factor BamD
MYVADFYARRARWPAVAARLRVLLDTYPGVGLTEEAYWKLHDACLKMEKPDEARRVLEEIQKALPNTPSAQRAQRLMKP